MIWNTTTPRDNGPCSTVLDRNCTLLFANAHRYPAQFAGVQSLLVEGLLVPFHVGGEASARSGSSRTMTGASSMRKTGECSTAFAATAYQVLGNLDVFQQQAEALREADRRKSEFLAMLAHELRNPRAIRSAVEILRLSGDDEQHAKPAVLDHPCVQQGPTCGGPKTSERRRL